MLTFGHIPAAKGDENADLAVSDDRRALTYTFSDLRAAVGDKSPAPVAARVFSRVLPLEGDGARAEVEFTVQGYVAATGGGTATLVCSVNGQSTVTDFPAAADESIVQKLRFAADRPADCRLCVFLLAGRDSGNADAEVHLNVTAVDAEILPRPR